MQKKRWMLFKERTSGVKLSSLNGVRRVVDLNLETVTEETSELGVDTVGATVERGEGIGVEGVHLMVGVPGVRVEETGETETGIGGELIEEVILMTAGAGEGVGPIHLEEIRGDRGVAANLVEVIARTRCLITTRTRITIIITITTATTTRRWVVTTSKGRTVKAGAVLEIIIIDIVVKKEIELLFILYIHIPYILLFLLSPPPPPLLPISNIYHSPLFYYTSTLINNNHNHHHNHNKHLHPLYSHNKHLHLKASLT